MMGEKNIGKKKRALDDEKRNKTVKDFSGIAVLRYQKWRSFAYYELLS